MDRVIDMGLRNLFWYSLYLFLLPIQTVYFLREPFIDGVKWQYGTAGIYFSDLLLIGALVFFVASGFIWKKFQISNFKYRISTGLLTIFVLWAGVSILWAPDQVLAGYFFIKLILATAVFFLARSLGEEDRKTFVWVLIAAAVLQSFLGIGQFILQSTFASTLLGMSVHEVWQAGTSVLKNDSGRWLRAYGSFEHPNMLGGFLATALVMVIAYAVSFGESIMKTVAMSREELRQSGASLWERSSDTVRMVVVAGAGMLILLALILTFSRSAWLGAGMGILFLIAQFFFLNVTSKQRSRNYVIFLKTLGMLGVAGIVFVGALHETVFPRFDSTVIESEGSVSERVQSFEDAQMVIGEGNIFLGTGAGNFTAQSMRSQPDRSVWTIQPAHNVFVLIFAELGLVGTVLFIAFLFSIFFKTEKIKCYIIRRPSFRVTFLNERNMVFVGAFVAVVPALLLDHYLWTSHFGLIFFFLLLGLALKEN